MKIYHTETQEDYDALMRELSDRSIRIIQSYGFKLNYERTVIYVDNKDSSIGCVETAIEKYPFIKITEYKAKDNFVTAESFSLSNAIEQNEGDIEAYCKIINDLKQTYISKNKDYGNSFEESLDEFGEIAGIVRIGDKFNRIKSLSKTEEINVKDESKIDTLLDMANYCIMQAKWLMKEER